MKKIKQVLALLGVVVLLSMYIATFFFAMIKSPNSRNWFMASVLCTIAIPILLYGFMLVYRHVQTRAITIDTIVFDIGNVLVTYDGMAYLHSLGYDEETCQAVAKATFLSEEWNERDKGLLTDEQYMRLFIDNNRDYEEQIRKFVETAENTVHAVDYSVGWIRSLKKKGYEIYLLSNYSKTMYQKNEAQMPFRDLVDGAVISYEVHQIKPDPAIYQTLLHKYNIKPSTAVFLDDRAENVQAAKDAGMHGIVFKDFESAVYELGMLGVK